MTAPVDARRVALTALAVVGDLTGVSVSFAAGGGAVISVHEADVPFLARLLDLTGLTVSDASETRHVRDRDLVAFERTRYAHLGGGLRVDWYCEDGDSSLADLADYQHAVSRGGAA